MERVRQDMGTYQETGGLSPEAMGTVRASRSEAEADRGDDGTVPVAG
ncbi:MAG: hypothetical protein ABFD18_12700 [Syntrophomonas sp.]